jgi:CRISPR-associated protein (TIGR02584 family)
MEPVKNILICVVGMSPQVVTETLYALMFQQQKPITIDEIHLISTTDGLDSIKKYLLLPVKGYFYQFCEDYGLEPHKILVVENVITHFDGRPLQDIRTSDENEAARDFIVQYIAVQSRRDDTRIFASIAGGRKTMSAYMSLAMNLYGRPEDSLSHVLVYPSEQELGWDFYYPRPKVKKIKLKNGTVMPMKDVRIELAEIPFVKLRPILEGYLKEKYQNIETLFQISQKTIDALGQQVSLLFDSNKLEIKILNQDNDEIGRIKLPPKEAAIYILGLKSKEPIPIQYMDKELDEIYNQVSKKTFEEKPNWDPDHIQKKISNLNSKIKKELPTYLYHQVMFNKVKPESDPITHYYIPLPFDKRQIVA